MQSQRENLSLQQKMLSDKCRTDISRRQTHSKSEKYPSTSTCVSLCEFIYQKTSWIFSPSLACKWAQMSLIKPLLINSLREAVLSVDLKNWKKEKIQFHTVHFSAINFVLVSNLTVFIPAKCQTCYRYSFEVCFFKEF